jgi:SAM-dependent methyltransferase
MTDTPPLIFDRSAYRAQRKRAGKAGGETLLVDLAISALAERVSVVNRRFTDALNLGCYEKPSHKLTNLAENWTYAGIVQPIQNSDSWVVADEDALPFAEKSFDLIVSALSLHVVNDLPGALVQIRRALKPDGLFVAAMFGGDTLSELRVSFANAETKISGGVSPRVLPFADMLKLGSLLQRAGFALPVTDIERTILRYRDIVKLFTDLRAMGETNVLAARTRTPLTRRLLGSLVEEYVDGYADSDDRIPATFETIFLTGWAPHESQQRPLRPGSAKMRLADALGTKEHPSGEKPRGL